MVRRDITGKKFGKFTAIRYIGRGHHGGSMWLVKCDCGAERVYSLTDLKTKKSCRRCWVPSNKLDAGRAARNEVFGQYKRQARKRNLEWNLSRAQFEWITARPCFYCQAEGESGLDRLNNMDGYKINNVVACCFTCNRAKNSMSIKEFAEWIQKVAKNFLTKPLCRTVLDTAALRSGGSPLFLVRESGE